MSRFKTISSADNAQYKALKKLASQARERRKQQQTLLDGVHLIQAVIDAGFEWRAQLTHLIVRAGDEQQHEIQSCLQALADTPALLLDAALFDALSPVETPTGLLALFDIPAPRPHAHQLAVALENIQDPGNLGSILRTAAAAGADAVYLSKGCAEAWSPKCLRAAMGAHFAIVIHENADLTTLSADYPQRIATRLDATLSLYALDLRQPSLFLFGNEGQGLSDELAASASHAVTIPMPGATESLNVAAATAVCLFEQVRQCQTR